MPEVQALLACAQRQKTRIGIRGGVVRNFLLRLQSKRGVPANLVDLVDPFSDVDCVLDKEFDWPSVGTAISSTFPFAGYHRWEVETLEALSPRLSQYEKLPSERLIVWHDGYEDNRPRVTLEGLGMSPLQILEEVGLQTTSDRGPSQTQEDPWTTVLDALRFARYLLQFPDVRPQPERAVIPDRVVFERLLSSGIPPRTLQKNLLRLDLAVLDIITTADLLDPATFYLRQFWSNVPERLREMRTVLADLVMRNLADYEFVGGLVYRPRPSETLRAKLRVDRGGGGERLGVKSLIPWTPLWSLQSAEDSCCRHTDFRNGVAVVSWRPIKSDIPFDEDVAFDFAPAVQIDSSTPYAEASGKTPLLLPIPGFVRTGPSVTLRMDHAFPSTFLSRNLRFFAGLIDTREG